LTAFAQSILPRSDIPDFLLEKLEDETGERRLDCRVQPLKPALNFNFSFYTGYVVEVPMKQFFGAGHSWTILVRVTPRAESGSPVYLGTRLNLPHVPRTNVELRYGGGFLVGEGRYTVDWMLLDTNGRICRRQWQIEAKRNRGTRSAELSLEPHTIRPMSLPRWSGTSRRFHAPRLERLTVLLHAAPQFRRGRWAYDRLVLISMLSALLDQLPARSVRLVVFNLDQQKEVFRRNSFVPDDFGAVRESLNLLELNLIDYRTLQNRNGYLNLLTKLIEEEVRTEEPADAVVFLGPPARYTDQVPDASLTPVRNMPRFLYFQRKTVIGRADVPDSIQRAVKKLGGKTVHIYTPADFANAISQLDKELASSDSR
jgi:hypothetical protein